MSPEFAPTERLLQVSLPDVSEFVSCNNSLRYGALYSHIRDRQDRLLHPDKYVSLAEEIRLTMKEQDDIMKDILNEVKSELELGDSGGVPEENESTVCKAAASTGCGAVVEVVDAPSKSPSENLRINPVPQLPIGLDNASLLNAGDVVEARHGIGNQWFPGKVGAVHSTEHGYLYDVSFDDGDFEARCYRRKLRQKGEKQSRKCEVGQIVDSKCDTCGGAVVPGRISGIVDGMEDTYEVEFSRQEISDLCGDGVASNVNDDVFRETMHRKFLFTSYQLPPGDSAYSTPVQTPVGAASVKDGFEKNKSSSLVLNTSDIGSSSKNSMSAAGIATPMSTPALSFSSPNAQDFVSLPVGAKVQARYGWGSDWFDASVVEVKNVETEEGQNPEQLYCLQYDDGDVEENVRRLKLRLVGQKQSRSLAVGENVDALCDVFKDRYLAGVVSNILESDMYEISFDMQILGLLDEFMDVCKNNASLKQYYQSHTNEGENVVYKAVLHRKNIFAAYRGQPSAPPEAASNSSSSPPPVVDTILQKIHCYVNEIMPMLCRVLLPLYGKPASVTTEPGPLEVPIGYINGKMYRFIGNSIEQDSSVTSKSVYPIPKGCNLYVQCFRNSSYETVTLNASSNCVIDMENNEQMSKMLYLFLSLAMYSFLCLVFCRSSEKNIEVGF